MSQYKTFTAITDLGPYVTKLILELPCEVYAGSISKDYFNVYVERKNVVTGNIIMTKDFFSSDPPHASKGYREVKKAFPCDEKGNSREKGNYVALEFEEEELGRRVEGNGMSSTYVFCDYRITLLRELAADTPISGLVFDSDAGDICPQLEGWKNGASDSGIAMLPKESWNLKYGYYTPKDTSTKLPLIVWLHGAGEGGIDPTIAYTGNKVVSISTPEIQGYFGKGAWILAPQCPTVWMDDGKEQIGHSNRSIYTEALMHCIDEFVEEHESLIDKNRILIGGCSNGGFMTMRMILDFPDYFAAAYPICEYFLNENISEKMLERIRNLPIWFVHAKKDELVSPYTTSLPLYHRLVKAGARNVHFTFFDHMEDKTGMYKDEYGRPKRFFSHGIWIHVLNDDCREDFDGRYVVYEGEPVTLWQWLGKQHRN